MLLCIRVMNRSFRQIYAHKTVTYEIWGATITPNLSSIRRSDPQWRAAPVHNSRPVILFLVEVQRRYFPLGHLAQLDGPWRPIGRDGCFNPKFSICSSA